MLKYQTYGSKSSIDIDIIVFVPKLGTIQDNKDTISKYKELLSSKYDKKVDVHLAVLCPEKQQIIDVSHGTADEVNNSLYYTYSNFQQPFENMIKSTVKRDKVLKYLRVSRFILSFYSRVPEFRNKIKSALPGSFYDRLQVLKELDFVKHTEFTGKKERIEDIYKVLAFQLAQCLGLYNDIEIYTKEDVNKHYKELSKCISRNKLTIIDLTILNHCLNQYICICENLNVDLKQIYE